MLYSARTFQRIFYRFDREYGLGNTTYCNGEIIHYRYDYRSETIIEIDQSNWSLPRISIFNTDTKIVNLEQIPNWGF